MARKLITQDDLLAWMNSELHKFEDTKDCRFTSVKSVDYSKGKDGNKCNWGETNFNCSGVPVEVYQGIAKSIVEKAKEKYNIKK